MTKPTPAVIKKELQRLRKFIDGEKESSIEVRIAWQVENILRWVTERTKGWPKPLESAIEMAHLIRRDMYRPK